MPRNKRYWRRHGIAELMNWMMGGLNSDGQYALGKSAKSYRYHCPRWLDYFVTEVGGHALCYSPRSTAALFKKALCPFTLALFEGVPIFALSLILSAGLHLSPSKITAQQSSHV